MPLLLVPLLFLLVIVAAIALLPLSLFQRYRVGAARRPARGWFIALNLTAIVFSTILFLIGAAVTNAWVADTFVYSLIGFAAGCVLGMIGLALTRWEITPQSFHFTPNRWLVLLVTLLVTARVLYGFWRSWHVWNAGLQAWSEAFGVASSMGVGAAVLGYYFAYWLGVRRRFRKHQSR